MFTLLCILAVIYVFLKVSNTRAEFARRDAEREAREQAEAVAMEEAFEEEEIRSTAVDVDAETLEDPEDVEFDIVGDDEDEKPRPIEIEIPQAQAVAEEV